MNALNFFKFIEDKKGKKIPFMYKLIHAPETLTDEDFVRHDCKDRIAKLEALLGSSAKEKDDLRNLVLKLTSEVAELRIKVEFFENNKIFQK